MRVEPLHTIDEFRAEGAHNFRERRPKNADPARRHLNQILIGPSSNLAGAAEDKIAKLRKRANTTRIGASGMMIVSREALTVDGTKLGELCPQKVENFSSKSREFLQAAYGDSVISAVLHCDETSPHIHVAFIPQFKRWISYNSHFGSGAKLSAMQDNYADALNAGPNPLGVKRGEIRMPGEAEHEEVADYYRRVNKARATLSPPPPIPRPEVPSRLIWTTDKVQGLLDDQHQRYEAAMTDYYDQVMTVIAQAVERAAQTDAWEKTAQNLQDQLTEAQNFQQQRELETQQLQRQLINELEKKYTETIENLKADRQNLLERGNAWERCFRRLTNLVESINDNDSLERAIRYARQTIPPDSPAPQVQEKATRHRM